MTPDRSHSDTVGRVANKVRVEGGELWSVANKVGVEWANWTCCKQSKGWSFAPFNPYFYVPKYRSSDALPAPEIFFNVLSLIFSLDLKLYVGNLLLLGDKNTIKLFYQWIIGVPFHQCFIFKINGILHIWNLVFSKKLKFWLGWKEE